MIKSKILVAEDNVTNQRVAQRMLTKLGFDADIACDGIEVINSLKSKHYDLVLMDCQMPLLDGFEATAAIRAMESDERNIIIIAMTANAMQGDRERCIAAGMNDYLAKPVTLDALKSIINKWAVENSKNGAASLAGLGNPDEHAAPVLDKLRIAELENLSDDGDREWMNELFGQFSKDTQERILALTQEAEHPDISRAQRVLHQLKGSCRNVGAADMALRCIQIEENVKTGITGDFKLRLAELNSAFARVKIEIAKYLQQGSAS